MFLSRDKLSHAVSQEGLVFLGVVSLDVSQDYARFEAWLDERRHGDMAFMENHRRFRKDPAGLLPGATSAIVVALPYHLGDALSGEGVPRVAQYARLPDYHKVLRRKGERIARSLGDQKNFRIAVDSAPVLERALAAKTADGFIGKNTCYIHPTKGSFLLLAEILTTVPLEIDEKNPVGTDRKTKAGGCGPCDLCQVHCPTGALDRDYTLDAKRCLSYWTIEHRGTIPYEFWPHLAKYYFGCDLCQLACPYNGKSMGKTLPQDLEERQLPSLFATATMTQAEYETYFGGTPLTRAKRNGLRRNALIAMAVTNDAELDEAMRLAKEDPGAPVGDTLQQIEKFLASRDRRSEVLTER